MTRWNLVAAAALGAALAAGSAWAAGKGAPTTVKVRALLAKVMSEPNYLSDVVAEVKSGQSLTVLATDKSGYWTKVSVGAKSGWLQRAALWNKKVELSAKAGSEGGSVSGDEAELAGRGFNAETEQAYRAEKQGPGAAQIEAAFRLVDAIQTVSAQPSEAREFAKAGGAR